ncbi:hypothetical protein N7533_010523 [Penicillium manginii]|uniref:uncharacterized protein n=1 Tax=Penicillium manginii TaxID=203109 RepID=UPI002546DC5D|nr:uncharacterized protein N7533_010523 [Penicillium manginii]KAJ5743421.1 hypothetical protein N7533_010523 [Penicillium manginii]
MTDAGSPPKQTAIATIAETAAQTETESMRLLFQEKDFPQCNWCKHHNLACTFNRIRANANLGSNRVTVATSSTGEKDGPNIGEGPASQVADSTWSSRIGNTFLNNVTYLRGHHVFSNEGQRWIESQVGEVVNFDKLFSLELRWLKPLRSYTDPKMYPQFPSRVNVERYVQIYGSSSQSLVFPVISQSIFGKTLELVYSPLHPPWFYERQIVRLCLPLTDLPVWPG